MHIDSTAVGPSPLDSDFVRVDLTICSDRPGLSLKYWVDLPADLAPRSAPANALALVMLPIAFYFGEDACIGEPVDASLLENLKGVQQIWQTWYPAFKPVRVLAPLAVRSSSRAQKRTLASFSGGIDSFFSLLRHRDEITDLVSIAGFNTPIGDFDNMRRELDPIARRFNARHVPVVTNIRYGNHLPTPYSIEEMMVGLAHGCLLAAIAHMMETHFDTYVIPASHSFSHLLPFGSHPLTDPLYSSTGLRIVHDGAAFDRVERTRVVACSNDALSVLHVCWQDFMTGNCSKCEKCLRTMATLDLLGARERAGSFDWSGYSPARLARTWLPDESQRVFFMEIASLARAVGRPDLHCAVEAAVSSSYRKAVVFDALNAAWRLVRRAIKSNPITGWMWNGLRSFRSVPGNVEATR